MTRDEWIAHCVAIRLTSGEYMSWQGAVKLLDIIHPFQEVILHAYGRSAEHLPKLLKDINPTKDFMEAWRSVVLWAMPLIAEDAANDTMKPKTAQFRAFYRQRDYLSPAYRLVAPATHAAVSTDILHYIRNRKRRLAARAAIRRAIV